MSRTAKLLTPIWRILPALCKASSAFIVSRSGTWPHGSGQCTWYKSISRTPSRFRLAAHAFRTSSGRRCHPPTFVAMKRSEEHTSELQSQSNLVCRLLLEKKKNHRSTANLSPTAPPRPHCSQRYDRSDRHSAVVPIAPPSC